MPIQNITTDKMRPKVRRKRNTEEKQSLESLEVIEMQAAGKINRKKQSVMAYRR